MVVRRFLHTLVLALVADYSYTAFALQQSFLSETPLAAADKVQHVLEHRPKSQLSQCTVSPHSDPDGLPRTLTRVVDRPHRGHTVRL